MFLFSLFLIESGIQALDYGTPESSRSPLTRRIIYNRLHNLLQHLLSLIPTLSSTLHPLLVRNFPHKRQELVAQTTYIRNILRVSEYCHQLGDKILAIIVDRAIQIDVRFQNSLFMHQLTILPQVEIQVELEDEEEEQADTEVFEVDPFDTLLGQEGEINDSDSDSDSDDGNLSDISSEADDNNDIIYTMEGPINIPHIREMVKKLDAILTLIFDHFNRTHLSTNAADPACAESARSTPMPGSDPSEQESQPPLDSERARILRKSQFHTLLAIFDRTIIRTFKSRYTQFLVFWFASLDPEFSDLFQGMLVSKALLENDQPEVTRAASASYIGSFVSRASFVEREGARRVMRVLCEFLGNHLDIYEAYVQSGTVPSTAHHGVFYAVSQAVFLIFCFRWRDFLEEEQEADAEVVPAGKKWMPSLSVIQRVIISTLNPLKVTFFIFPLVYLNLQFFLQICSNNVVMQFARVSQAADFIYCYSIMESNKRSEFQTNSDNTNKSISTPAFFLGNSSLHAELNTFFPFDPYKLPKSNKYIEGIYRDWSSVAIDEEDSDNDSNDEEDNEHEGYLNKPQDTEISFASYLDIPHAGDNMDDAGLILGESLGAMSISPVRPETLIPLRFDH